MTVSGTSPASPAAQLPTNHRMGFLDTLDTMGSSTGAALKDLAYVTNVADRTDDGTKINGAMVAGYGTAVAGTGALYAAVKAFQGPAEPAATGAASGFGARAAFGVRALGRDATTLGVRLSPVMIAALAGPALADASTSVLPNLVPKRLDTSRIQGAEAKTAADDRNQVARWTRMATAAVGVGALGVGAFLIRPTLFRDLTHGQAKYISDGLLQGRTSVTYLREGIPTTQRYVGKLSEQQVRDKLRAGGTVLPDDGDLKVTYRPGMSPFGGTRAEDVPGDPVTSNRIVVGATGAVATAFAANRALDADPKSRARAKRLATAAGVGVATAGATVGIGMLTRHAVAKDPGSWLGRNRLFPKVPLSWETAGNLAKISSLTAGPAMLSAGMYYNFFDGYDKIVAPSSQFRK